MTYTTLAFAAFVIVTAAIYFLFPVKKYQWTVLLAASCFFYLYNSYRYAFFILFTTLTIYAAALRIDRIGQESKATVKAKKAEWSKEERKAYKAQMESRSKRILALTLVVNFGILVFLKYYNFLAGGLNTLIAGQAEAASGGLPIFKLFLPLGISFYTFQSTGYLIDVHRGNVQAERNLGKLALFISFFPQIIQGPISTFGQLQEQLTRENKLTWENFKLGSELILWGMFKKLIIADRAVTAINSVTADYTQYTGTVILFIALLYALQLYADFSGGIDISRGVCRILGIDLMQNFRQPYFSKSINEYWRRWHISLGGWMKNYVFYTLAMSETFLNASKKMKASRFGQTPAGAHISKVLPTSIASVIVFFLVGIWHGPNSRYVAFGVWNGGIIMISMLLKPLADKWISALHLKADSFLWRLVQMLRTFV
ncbi:MAG: MBOAT family protein, partial [Mogibacterium sp.]|nr:MBOAT family protein [Mogibacterium sp.]